MRLIHKLRIFIWFGAKIRDAYRDERPWRGDHRDPRGSAN